MSHARLLLVGVLVALLVALVLLLVALTRSMVGTARASVLISLGRYADARRYLESAVARRPTWLGFPPSLHRTSVFHLAACDFEEGRLDEAVARLRTIRTKQRLLGDAVEAMIAATLVVAGVEPTEARERLERIVGRRSSPNIVLLLAHALLSEGDDEAARAMFATVDDATGRAKSPLAWGGFVRFDGITRARFTEPFLRGWFLLRTGDAERAAPLLEEAARCRVANRFSTMATTLRASDGRSRRPHAPDGHD